MADITSSGEASDFPTYGPYDQEVTVPSGADQFIIVVVGWNENDIDSLDWDGPGGVDAFTLVASSSTGSGGSKVGHDIWVCRPTSTGAGDIQFSTTPHGASGGPAMMWAVGTGLGDKVDDDDDPGGDYGPPTSYDVTVTTTSGGIAFAAGRSSNPNLDVNGTLADDAPHTFRGISQILSWEDTDGSNLDFDFTDIQFGSICAVSFETAGAGATDIAVLRRRREGC